MKRTRTYIAEDEDSRIEITIKQSRKVDFNKQDIDGKCEDFFDKIYLTLLDKFYQSSIKIRK